MTKRIISGTSWLITLLLLQQILFAQAPAPIRLAVAGTSHGHVAWILGKKDQKDVILSGIYEPDTALIRKQIKNYGLPASLFYTDLARMLDEVKPEAVVAFGSIYDHLSVVEACAPRRINVMVEKPLAVSVQHAMRMDSLAKKYGILLLTDYETSWYATTEKGYELAVDSNFAGAIRKVVFHHGHEGPKEIGVSKEFFNWLTDPVKNGGGALIDFGCYGANIMTYLMKGVKPLAVTAVTRHFKPAIYPKVDDDATIIVEYPGAQCIIQASWNWPFGRKDMEIYGETGYIIAVDKNVLRTRNKAAKEEKTSILHPADVGVYEDPFAYFADVIRKKIRPADYSLYSLTNNMLVVKILSAARESAATGKRVVLQ
ncbi:MAG TPA: Gfo/Idh/MocA family oxidoreductase [Chitinophagaceae bacterium]|nr:Gfo/Idh/MocA family oxidoreductase [Chitinophagaceae bacterium]